MPTLLFIEAINLSKIKYPDFTRKIRYVSLTHPGEYAVYEGKIKVDGMVLQPKEFLLRVREFQAEDRVAKRTHFENKSYMVGALARLNNNRDSYHL